MAPVPGASKDGSPAAKSGPRSRTPSGLRDKRSAAIRNPRKLGSKLNQAWVTDDCFRPKSGSSTAKIDDRKAAEDLYAYYVPVFQKIPRPSFVGMQTLREFLVAKYPAAASLKESDIADPSFIDELEQSGFIDRLYATDTR